MLALRLADDRDIEAPRDASEHGGGAAAGWRRGCASRAETPALRAAASKLCDGVLGGLAVLLALDLDQVGWNAAEAGVRE